MNIDDLDLSPELRAKAEACKSPEELLALAKQEGYKLSDEEMKAVSGGWGDDECESEDCNMYKPY